MYVRPILKAVYSDPAGFAVWMKRLEKHRFPWPATGEQLRQLLSGIAFWQAHQRLESSLGEAVRYALAQADRMIRYLE